MATREFEGAAALEGFPNAWKRVMTDPRAFFAEMPEVGGLQPPLAFLGVTAVINAAGHLVLGWGLGGFLRIVLWQQGRIGITQGTTGSELPPALLSRHDRHILRSGFSAIHRLLDWQW